MLKRFGTIIGLITAFSSSAWGGSATAIGPVLPLNHIEQLLVIDGRADFDEGPINGSIPLTEYQVDGFRFATGTLSNILPGCTTLGSAYNGSYSGNYDAYFTNLLGGGTHAAQAAVHAGVGTFATTVTRMGLTASKNGNQYITAWDSAGNIIGQVNWSPQSAPGFVGIDTQGTPIAMIAYGNDDLYNGGTYSIGGATIISDSWVWGPGPECLQSDVTTQGAVTAITSPQQMSNILGQAAFDEGPTSGALPLGTYTAGGLTFHADALTNIISGVTNAGTAPNPEYATTGAFSLPSCGPAQVVDQHIALGGVATFSNAVTQIALAASGEGTRYLTAWDSSGALIGQVKWTANGGTRLIGLATNGTAIAMIAYGDDDVFNGADYDPGTDVFSDSWVWAGGCTTDTDCDNGNQCDGAEVCTSGLCEPASTVASCDDSNPCTTDMCNAATGCTYKNNSNACSDGDACTMGDVCVGGSCTGQPKNCDDNNACTDESCDSSTGCVYTDNTASCDDDDACTENDLCAAGLCAGTAVECTDDNDCTTDSCDSMIGCLFTNNTDPCDDADQCTDNDLCTEGSCLGSAVDCDDDDICTADSCDMVDGCGNAPITNCCKDDSDCADGETCDLQSHECGADGSTSGSGSGGGSGVGGSGSSTETPTASASCSCATPGRGDYNRSAWLLGLLALALYSRRTAPRATQR